MHDIRKIRENPQKFDEALLRRHHLACSKKILQLDASRREKILAAERAQAERNEASNQIQKAKIEKDDAKFSSLKALVTQKKREIAQLEVDAKDADKELKSLLLQLPNLIDSEVPDGKDERYNEEIRSWGTPRKFVFDPKEHFKISAAEGLNFIDAAKISGSRFVVLEGSMAMLHRALAQFMLQTHIKNHGLTEVWTPVLVKSETMVGTGQLPKFSADSYCTSDDKWLIPTSEVSVTNIFANKILNENELPKRLTCHSQCFRSEAGSAGKDTSGMLRQHQFEKVEMISIVKPEESANELERMTACAQNILELLELPYRTMVLCSGDLGFSAKRTNDIEVWLPGQNKYREISSCSICGDFQARRMNARYRPSKGSKPDFVHTLNGSGLAVGRCLIAVLENYQEEDGSITIPTVLKSFLGEASRITCQGALE